MMKGFIESMNTKVDQLEATHGASIQNLEIYLEQLAQVVHQRPQGSFLRGTKVNEKRKGKNNCKAIALRSIKVLEEKEAMKEPKLEDVEKENLKIK